MCGSNARSLPVTNHRTAIATLALFSMFTLGGRAPVAAVNANATLSVVRSSTMAGPNFVADFNGDGKPDVAGSAPLAPGATVSKVRVALGIALAGFQTPIDT